MLRTRGNSSAPETFLGSNHSERWSWITKIGKAERDLGAPHLSRDTRLILVIYHQSTAMKCSEQVKHGTESEDLNSGREFTCRRDIGSSPSSQCPLLGPPVRNGIIISLKDYKRQGHEGKWFLKRDLGILSTNWCQSLLLSDLSGTHLCVCLSRVLKQADKSYKKNTNLVLVVKEQTPLLPVSWSKIEVLLHSRVLGCAVLLKNWWKWRARTKVNPWKIYIHSS